MQTLQFQLIDLLYEADKNQFVFKVELLDNILYQSIVDSLRKIQITFSLSSSVSRLDFIVYAHKNEVDFINQDKINGKNRLHHHIIVYLRLDEQLHDVSYNIEIYVVQLKFWIGKNQIAILQIKKSFQLRDISLERVKDSRLLKNRYCSTDNSEKLARGINQNPETMTANEIINESGSNNEYKTDVFSTVIYENKSKVPALFEFAKMYRTLPLPNLVEDADDLEQLLATNLTDVGTILEETNAAYLEIKCSIIKFLLQLIMEDSSVQMAFFNLLKKYFPYFPKVQKQKRGKI